MNVGQAAEEAEEALRLTTLRVQADRSRLGGEGLRTALHVRLAGSDEVLTIPVSVAPR